jgi:hypothetical protein
MFRGVGKAWAKGLTAATDPRVARAAAAHRGRKYQRRTPVEDCNYRFANKTLLPLRWSRDMAYIVGLTATDGCLYTGRRKLNFKSTDRQLVETYLNLLGRTNRVKTQRTDNGGTVYFTEFHDSRLYAWFLSVGLTPRKSLTLGSLAVPRDLFSETARGLLDGDGSILNFRYPGTGKARGREYETIWVCFNSASRAHLEWVRAELRAIANVEGSLTLDSYTSAGNPFYRLTYAMRETKTILSLIYADPDAPCLRRKRDLWLDFVRRDLAGETRSRLL